MKLKIGKTLNVNNVNVILLFIKINNEIII